MKKLFSLSILAILASLTLFVGQSHALANPASVKCSTDGGILVMKSNADASQYGECTFPDGAVCEEWAYFRGTCHTNGILTVTVAPAKVYCTTMMDSECLALSVSGTNTTIKVPEILGFNFNKGNTYTLDLKSAVTQSGSKIDYTLVKEISRTFDPQVCTSSTYSDGCNTCTVSTNGQTACTEMACVRAGIPSCAHDEPLISPIACTMEYNPVCDSSGTIYGNACMAGASGLSEDEYAAAYCPYSPESNLKTIQRALSHGITQFTTTKTFMGDKSIPRVHAAKMFTAFATLYTDNTIVNVSSSQECIFKDTKYISSDLQSHIAQACTFGLFQGYRNNFMPNNILTRGQAKIVLGRLIGDDTVVSSVLETSFADKNMRQAISRIELITVMKNVYDAHLLTLSMKTIHGTVTEYDTSPTAYDGIIIFSLDNIRYDIGGGMRMQAQYDTAMSVISGNHRYEGTLSQYSNLIATGDTMTITVPKGSHSLYNCNECRITLTK